MPDLDRKILELKDEYGNHLEADKIIEDSTSATALASVSGFIRTWLDTDLCGYETTKLSRLGNMGSMGVFLHMAHCSSFRFVEKISTDANEMLFYTHYLGEPCSTLTDIAPDLYAVKQVSHSIIQIFMEYCGEEAKQVSSIEFAMQLGKVAGAISTLPVRYELRSIKSILKESHLSKLKDFLDFSGYASHLKELALKERALLERLEILHSTLERAPYVVSHCDLKRQNLSVTERGCLKVFDWGQFGLARVGHDLREFLCVDDPCVIDNPYNRAMAAEYVRAISAVPLLEDISTETVLLLSLFEQLHWSVRKCIDSESHFRSRNENHVFIDIAFKCLRATLEFPVHHG